MPLEDLIRKAIREGRFDGLTLWPCSAGFQSNLKNKKGGWDCHVDEDPIAAMRAALGEPDTSRITTDNEGVFG